MRGFLSESTKQASTQPSGMISNPVSIAASLCQMHSTNGLSRGVGRYSAQMSMDHTWSFRMIRESWSRRLHRSKRRAFTFHEADGMLRLLEMHRFQQGHKIN